jgi:hypothetical protein
VYCPIDQHTEPHILACYASRLPYTAVCSQVRQGYVCMHGFDHRTTEGSEVVNFALWDKGGEFSRYNRTQLHELWERSDAILQQVRNMACLADRTGISTWDMDMELRVHASSPDWPRSNVMAYGRWSGTRVPTSSLRSTRSHRI